MGDLSSQTHASNPEPQRGHRWRAAALDLAIRCLDLTSLDGDETTDQVLALCDRAVRPDPEDPAVPSVAAVVLYPALVGSAADRLSGTSVKVAAVAGFPLPEGPLEDRLEEIRRAVVAGAGEVDVVLNRELLLSGHQGDVAQEVARSKEAASPALLKVILETGELGTDDRIREAAGVAMTAGADFIKSSTGKVGAGVTPEAARSMMEAAREHQAKTGKAVGIKVSGGVRTTEQALSYLELLEKVLGSEWLTPERFRIGASSLLDDLVAQLRIERAGG